MITIKYSLRGPMNWGADAREHLFLANKLWNNLVALEHETRKAWNEAFCLDRDFKELRDQFEAASALVDSLWEERKKHRAKTRSKATEEDKEFAARIQVAKEQSSSLWASVKSMRNKLKDVPEIKDALQQTETNRREQVKVLRNASGLWWPNYNAIVESYETARVRAMKDGTQLKFHRFTGEGGFSVQIQGGMTASALFNGEDPNVSVSDISDEAFESMFGKSKPAHNKFKILKIAIYTTKEGTKTKRRYLTLPLYLSRDFPTNGIIKAVRVTCRKRESVPLPGDYDLPELIQRTTQPHVADPYEWNVCFSVATPDTETPHKSTAACGVNLGWRQTDQGIRVATLVDSAGNFEHFYLSDVVMSKLFRAEQLQSELDDAANAMRDKLQTWLDGVDERSPEEWRVAVQAAINSRSHDKLYQLVMLWNTWGLHQFMPHWKQELGDWHNVRKPSKSDSDYKVKLDLFWNCDFRKRREMHGLRNRAYNYRLTTYQEIAKRIAQKYAMIGFGQLDLKKAAKTTDVEEVLPEVARSNRVRVSLFELESWLKQQAAKVNAEIVKAKRPVTSTCHCCGAKQSVPPNALFHTCTKCSSLWDRDINAATVALQDTIKSE